MTLDMHNDPWSSKCANVGCTGHLGKFDSCEDEALYEITMDGCCETTGDVEFNGHYSLVTLDHDETVKLWDDVTVIVPSGHYVVIATNSGAVLVDRYGQDGISARQDFSTYEERYSEWCDNDE